MATRVLSHTMRCEPCAETPNAAAHDETVHDGDIGFGIGVNQIVQPVLVAPEPARERRVAPAPGLVQARDIAAGAKGARTGAVHDHMAHIAVHAPINKRVLDFETHVVRKRVERVGPVQRDAPGPAHDAAFDRAHPSRPFSMDLLMIRRMISFVPSRIWWTRRSRTIFSIPNSLR